jgi:hypothetical protein
MTPRRVRTWGLILLTLTTNCGGDDAAESAGTTSSTAETASSTTPTAETSTTVAADAPAPEVITREGFGAIRIGMTVEEAQAAAGDGATYEAPKPDEDYACGDMTIGVPDLFVSFIPAQGSDEFRVRYIVSLNPDVRTDTGIGLGSTAADVRAKYPAAQVGGDQQAPALTVAGIPGELAFRFEVPSGEEIADDAEVSGIAVTDPAIADSDEYCA